MGKYKSKPLLDELKEANIVVSLKYYPEEGKKYWEVFKRFVKKPVGEIFLTDKAIYVFRGYKNILAGTRTFAIKIDRKDIRGAQLVEKQLHLNLTKNAFDEYLKFFNAHFRFYLNKGYDKDTDSVSFFGIDEKDAMKFLEGLGDKPEMKIEIKNQPRIEVRPANVEPRIVVPTPKVEIKNELRKEDKETKSNQKAVPRKINIPTKLLSWVNAKRKYEDSVTNIDWRILIFLYENRNTDCTIKYISDGIGEDYSKTQGRIRHLHKRLQLLKGKPKPGQKKEFWYFLPIVDD